MYILQLDNYTLLMVYRLPHYRNLKLQGTQDHTLFKVTLTNKRYIVRVKRFLKSLLPFAEFVIKSQTSFIPFAIHLSNNLAFKGVKHKIETGKFIKTFGG